jgi:hypothetical protein
VHEIFYRTPVALQRARIENLNILHSRTPNDGLKTSTNNLNFG